MPNTSFSIVDTIVCFQEKTKLEETVKKLEAEIISLKAAVKKMQCEKDEFAGHNIALKEEVEIYKVGYYLIVSLFDNGPHRCMHIAIMSYCPLFMKKLPFSRCPAS